MKWLWIAIMFGQTYSGPGAHPTVGDMIDVRLGVAEWFVGFRHSPALLKRPGAEATPAVADVFEYVAGAEVSSALSENVDLRMSLSAGYSVQRVWICTGTSCEATPGPGQRFRHNNGAVGGGGIALVIKDVARIELRGDHHFARNVPVRTSGTLLVGFEVGP